MVACSGGVCDKCLVHFWLSKDCWGHCLYFILEMPKRQSPKLGHSRWYGLLAGCELWNCINQDFCVGTLSHIVTHIWCPWNAELEFLGSFSIFGQNLQIKRIYAEEDNKFHVSFMAQHRRSDLDIDCRKYSMWLQKTYLSNLSPLFFTDLVFDIEVERKYYHLWFL